MMENLFKFKDTDPRNFPAGLLFRASQEKFPVLNGLAIQGLNLKPGAIREPHTHPNAHQLDYCVSGQAIVGIVEPGGERKELRLDHGDISFVPQGYLHWVKNVGTADLEFLVVLSHEEPQTLELSEMLRGVPSPDMHKMFGIEEVMLQKISNVGVIF
jgi:oxalate decarboxylase/phosphoglucose isomerase-like protein (cupin superfamily)